MTNAAYQALVPNAPFDVPAHPGPAPVHVAGAPQAQIAETIRLYNAELVEIGIVNTFQSKLKQQIIAAIEPLYLSALSHEEFGFADVAPLQMMEHLQADYGRITREEIEANRKSI